MAGVSAVAGGLDSELVAARLELELDRQRQRISTVDSDGGARCERAHLQNWKNDGQLLEGEVDLNELASAQLACLLRPSEPREVSFELVSPWFEGQDISRRFRRHRAIIDRERRPCRLTR
jgi:hypothetical protein